MIVLDEQLNRRKLIDEIAHWYRGTVCPITHLRHGTTIKDEAVAILLRTQNQPTFVTINEEDFWQRLVGDPRYCIICISIPDRSVGLLPNYLRRVLRHPNFRTKAQRMGHVLRVTQSSISYYNHQSNQVRMVALMP